MLNAAAPVSPASTSSFDASRIFTLDRWSQRRLQRLNAEQLFREQRQTSKDDAASAVTSTSEGAQSRADNNQQQQQQQTQGGGGQQSTSTPPPIHDRQAVSPPSTHLTFQDSTYHRFVNNSRFLPHSASVPNFAPVELAGDTPPVMASPGQQQQQQQLSKSPRTNRHTALASGSASAQGSSQPSAQTNGTTQSKKSEDTSSDDPAQLRKDHKELKEKYFKVKKLYFERDDQVKNLQNLLAHQRIAQSRTSLDDAQYGARLERLDGLIKQLAYSIRRSWKSVPSWLAPTINKDAMETGKQEMTAAGRAFISWWVNTEIFDKYFHPDIDKLLSEQLKIIQKNIRLGAPPPTTVEEDDTLSAKVVEWRLSTLDGLQSHLRSEHAAAHRTELTEMLKQRLSDALNTHLSDPPASDLAGGAAMIVELAVAMTASLPQESRDVQIEYAMPGSRFVPDTMRTIVDNGIPALEEEPPRASIDGERKKLPVPRSAGGTANSSSGSLVKEDATPRVRMAMGLSARVRGKDVLFKAQVHVL